MSPLFTQALDYRRDSRDLMLRLSQLPQPAFLDSGLGSDVSSRFDILTAEPVASLYSNGATWHCSDLRVRIDPSDLFASVRVLLRKYLPWLGIVAPAEALPFIGGALGCLGYPVLNGKADLEVRDACIGIYAWAVIVDHHRQQTTFVAQPSVSPDECSRLLSLLNAEIQQPVFALQGEFTRHLRRSEYDAAFAAIKAYIAAGDCYQVNLTQRVSAQVLGSPIAAYLQLRARIPAPFSAFMQWENQALLSVSPERFVQLDGRRVLTQPIKGTRPRYEDSELDRAAAAALQASEKDRAENLMIVDLLRNDLGRVCVTGSVRTEALFDLRSFSNVHHLVSSIRGELLPNQDGLDLLRACFPGGSITGAPKLRAMAVIAELEQSPRRLYCGSAFYLSACGRLDSSITIRSLMWEGDTLSCWAGGGIVDDSEVSAEYAECFDKIGAIMAALSAG